MEYLPTILALLGGVVIHITKKAATRKMEDKTFSLREYLLSNPYQTVTMLGVAAGAYLQLIGDPNSPITLFGAFTAGIAANSLSDIAKGQR